MTILLITAILLLTAQSPKMTNAQVQDCSTIPQCCDSCNAYPAGTDMTCNCVPQDNCKNECVACYNQCAASSITDSGDKTACESGCDYAASHCAQMQSTAAQNQCESDSRECFGTCHGTAAAPWNASAVAACNCGCEQCVSACNGYGENNAPNQYDCNVYCPQCVEKCNGGTACIQGCTNCATNCQRYLSNSTAPLSACLQSCSDDCVLQACGAAGPAFNDNCMKSCQACVTSNAPTAPIDASGCIDQSTTEDANTCIQTCIQAVIQYYAPSFQSLSQCYDNVCDSSTTSNCATLGCQACESNCATYGNPGACEQLCWSCLSSSCGTAFGNTEDSCVTSCPNCVPNCDGIPDAGDQMTCLAACYNRTTPNPTITCPDDMLVSHQQQKKTKIF